jgi:opacity protein-like surface antigen
MRHALFGLSLGLALGAGGTMPALAGGDIELDYRTGINPYAVATPVPAPIPVPVYEAAWYFRADFAAGFGTQPSVSTIGTPFGSGAAAGTVGLSPVLLSVDALPSFTGGVGVGYVWGPAFRTDLTVDIHSIMDVNFVGTTPYPGGSVNIADKTSFMSTILLANAYYDFRTGTPFTPYVGGGVGFAINRLSRDSSSTDSVTAITTSVGQGTTRFAFAGAAMAGLNYEISSFTSIDVNYRFLYIGGSDVDLTINGNGSSVEIGGISEHQIRAGLRFYIN